MIRFFLATVTMLALLAGIGGCSAQDAGRSLKVVSVSLAAGDPIRTYAQFEAAKDASYLRIQAKLPRRHDVPRAVVIVPMVAALPSRSSRDFARAMASALAPYGVVMPAVGEGGTSTMTYAELAEVEQLSEFLVNGWEQDDPTFAPLPPAASLDLQVAIARLCPSDAVGFSMLTRSSLDPKEFAPREEDWLAAIPVLQPKVELMATASYSRFTETSRPLNFTWVEMLDGGGETYLIMLTAVEPTGRQTRDFFEAVRANSARALKLPLSPEQVKQLTAMRKAAPGKAAIEKEPWSLLDENTLAAKEAEPVLRRFFEAAKTGDAAAAGRFVTTFESEGLREFVEKFHRQGGALRWVGAGIGEAGEVNCFVSLSAGPAGRYEVVPVIVKKRGMGYEIAKVPLWVGP